MFRSSDYTHESNINKPRLEEAKPEIVIPPALARLRGERRWVVWREGPNGKVPLNADTLLNASTDNPRTWRDLELAQHTYKDRQSHVDGIGFVLTRSEYAAFDIDDCRDATTGAIHPWVLSLIERSRSYAEVTPSGTGVRIIGLATDDHIHSTFAVPNTNGIVCEIYRKAVRFITITGQQIEGTANELVNIDALIDQTYAELGGVRRERSTARAYDKDRQAPLSYIATCVAAIPNNEDPKYNRDYWLRVGLAIYAATGGDAAGFKIFDDFSRRWPEYNETKTYKAWQSFCCSPPKSIGIGTLEYLADLAEPYWNSKLFLAMNKCERDIEFPPPAEPVLSDADIMKAFDGLADDFADFYKLCGLADPEDQAKGAPLIKEAAPGLHSEMPDIVAFRGTVPTKPPPPPPQIEGPRPLRRVLPPATPFPIGAFDCVPVLRDAIIAIEQRTRAPLAICGNSVLAAASVCAQAHADVRMPYNESRPLSDYFVTVAESGERKTSADDVALRAVREREARMRQDYAAAMQIYKEDLDAYTAHKKHLQKQHQGDRQALRNALARLGPEPSKPLKPTILIDNPTVEGIEKYAAEGQPSFGLFTAEGGKLIGGHLLNDDNRMKAGATLNLLWDGKPMPRYRIDYGDKLPGRRFAMHVMVQPGIAAGMLSDETLSSLGMLARCLVVAPDTAAGTRMWREVPASVEPALRAYSRALTVLLEKGSPRGNEPNELRPDALPLCGEATAMWIAYHDEVERKLADEGEWGAIRALGAKLPEHAARIAGVLTVVNDPDAFDMQIGTAELEGGILLANYYAAEALRLVDAGLTDPDLILAEKLLAWLLADPRRKETHPREIYQRGPYGIRDKATALRIVGILQDHGWLRPLRTNSEVEGKRRQQAWAVMRE
jgi:hypothetical protein